MQSPKVQPVKSGLPRQEVPKIKDLSGHMLLKNVIYSELPSSIREEYQPEDRAAKNIKNQTQEIQQVAPSAEHILGKINQDSAQSITDQANGYSSQDFPKPSSQPKFSGLGISYNSVDIYKIKHTMVDGDSTPLYSEREGPTEAILKQQKRQFTLSKQKSKLHYSTKNFNHLC